MQKHYSIHAWEWGRETEICQVDTNPEPICEALRARRRAVWRSVNSCPPLDRYQYVRWQDNNPT